MKFKELALFLASCYLAILISLHLKNYIDIFMYILLPFIVAFTLAFIMYPLKKVFVKKTNNNKLSTALAVIIVLYIIVYFLSVLYPLIMLEIALIREKLPILLNGIKENFSFIDLEKFQNQLLDFRIYKGVIDHLFLLLFVPTLAYYFLDKYEEIIHKLNVLTIDKPLTNQALKNINRNMKAYFRGVLFSASILFVSSTVCFYFLGLESPFLFGIIVGITDIIPFIGPYIGAIITSIFALDESLALAIMCYIVIFSLQTIEANLIAPYIHSKCIDIPVVFIILGFIVFSKMFGIVGMIFSTPMVIVTSDIIKYLIKIRKK